MECMWLNARPAVTEDFFTHENINVIAVLADVL